MALCFAFLSMAVLNELPRNTNLLLQLNPIKKLCCKIIKACLLIYLVEYWPYLLNISHLVGNVIFPF